MENSNFTLTTTFENNSPAPQQFFSIYIYIYIYTHTHTHTHIYIYIYIGPDSFSRRWGFTVADKGKGIEEGIALYEQGGMDG